MAELSVRLDEDDRLLIDSLDDSVIDLRKAVAEATAVLRDRFPIQAAHGLSDDVFSSSATPAMTVTPRSLPMHGFGAGERVTTLVSSIGPGISGTVVAPSATNESHQDMAERGYVLIERDDWVAEGDTGEDAQDWFRANHTVNTPALAKYRAPVERPLWERGPSDQDTPQTWNRRLLEAVVTHNRNEPVADRKLIVCFDYEKPASRGMPVWDSSKSVEYLRPTGIEVIGQFSQDVIVKGVDQVDDKLASFKLDRFSDYAKVVPKSSVPVKSNTNLRVSY